MLGIITFRPFPFDAVRAALKSAKRVVIIEKAFQVGIGGIVTENIASSIAGLDIESQTVIAGLGGRPITKTSLHTLFSDAITGNLDSLSFLDLDRELVEREILREGAAL